MRYLILTPNIGGNDGISQLTRRVAVAIAEIGGDVEVWSLSDDDRMQVSELVDARIHVRGARGGKARLTTWSLGRSLKDCRGLTVVVMHAHLAPLSLPLERRGARVFQVLHGIEVWKPLTALQSVAFRSSERLVCVSSHSARTFDEVNAGFDHKTVCHSGLPDRVFENELGDDGFALIVGRMAACERYKGHDVLLDVWPSVVERAPDAKLVVVGDGDDRERLIARTDELGLSGCVRFTGPVSNEDLDRLYRRCAFFVMPSANEGFGLVFLEAMRASKACIGGVGAASEIIEDGANGFILDPSDRGVLTDRVVELFTHAGRRAEMGARGRERFESEFTDARFRERWQSLLGGAR